MSPKCDQGPPPDAADISSAALCKREFLAAYCALNQSHCRLASVRATLGNPVEERAALEAVEKALLARDAVEDKYALLGITATPEFENGYVTNVHFVLPPRAPGGSSLSMVFAVQPMPPAAK